MTRLTSLLFILLLSSFANAQTIPVQYNLSVPTHTYYQSKDLNLEVTIPANIAKKGGWANCYLYKDTLGKEDYYDKNYIFPVNSPEQRYTFKIENVNYGCYFLRYSIRTKDTLGYRSPAKEICLSQLVSGISNSEETQIKFYPNPVSTELSIEISDASLTQLRIYDLQGHLVTTNNLNIGLNRFDIRYLSNGIYLLHLNNGTIAKLEVFK